MIALFSLLFKFFIFYFFLYFFGRAFFIILFNSKIEKQFDKKRLFEFSITTFYPLGGLILLGNLLFVLNFVLPIKNNFIFLILIFLIFNFKKRIQINQHKHLIKFLPVYLILLSSSYSTGFHYDSGLYHLNNQLWIRESNAVLGFTNIYSVFGVSSIYEYISSFLWFDKTFILLHFVNIVFIGLFYQFIIEGVLNHPNNHIKNAFSMILIFSLLDNFGFGGGRNGYLYIQSVGKQDVAIAIIYFLVSIFILYSLKEKKFSNNEIVFLTLVLLFLYQLKISSAPIFFLFLIYIYFYTKEKNFKKILKALLPASILGILWILKSIIHSGCIIFPLTSSCFKSLDWVYIDYLKAVQEVSVSYSSSYYFNSSFSNWLIQYFENGINKNIILNFLLSLFIILILNIRSIENKFSVKENVLIALFVLVNIIFYLRFGPDVRYLIGFQMFLVGLVGFYSSTQIKLNKYLILTTIYLSVLLVPRLQSYNMTNFSSTPEVVPSDVETIEFKGRLYPKTGDQCWVNLKCSANRNFFYIIEENKFYKKVLLDTNR